MYALASVLTDVHLLRASRSAIKNWIVAFAVSKIVTIQSSVRGWLTRLRLRSRDQAVVNSLPVSGVEEIHEEWDIITIQRWWRSRCAVMASLVSEAEDVVDAVVLAASEAVSAVTRLSGASRQFRSAITSPYWDQK